MQILRPILMLILILVLFPFMAAGFLFGLAGGAFRMGLPAGRPFLDWMVGRK